MSEIYIKRLTAPEYHNKNWLHSSAGGYNNCIRITSDGECIPNCVGYAWGRWRELLGYNHRLSRSNAEDWYWNNDGYQRGASPRLGAVMCWKKGVVGYGGDGAGHVAVVESIGTNGEITVSASDYGSSRFYIRKYHPPYTNSEPGLDFMGFIYPPIDFIDHKVVKPMCNLTIYRGGDRNETAEIVRNATNKYKYVNVSGKSIIDGLSSTFLARKYNASIIFDYSIEKKDALFQVGGDIDYNSNIKILTGDDRYLTNFEVLKHALGDEKRILVISGAQYIDGISAAATGLPILLVEDFVHFYQLDFLSRKKGLEFIIVGSIDVVNSIVAKQLAEIGKVMRIEGRNRYETSVEVAKYFFPNTSKITLVDNEVDGLVASQLEDGPIIIVNNNNTEYAKEYLKNKNISRAVVVGGITDYLANEVISK